MPAAVAGDPRVSEALQMRAQISKVEAATMESWQFDVCAFSHEELVAHLCKMFMQQSLCQTRVSLASRSSGQGLRPSSRACLGSLTSSAGQRFTAASKCLVVLLVEEALSAHKVRSQGACGIAGLGIHLGLSES